MTLDLGIDHGDNDVVLNNDSDNGFGENEIRKDEGIGPHNQRKLQRATAFLQAKPSKPTIPGEGTCH
jgi:hypothetical protein